MAEVTRFVLNGTEYQLTRAVVEARAATHSPEHGRKHLVSIGGVWFPVKQAFEIAIGVPRGRFTSHTARRHLAALGFDIAGEIEPRAGSTPADLTALPAPPPEPIRPFRVRLLGAAPDPPAEDWFTEANVQSLVVSWLAADGWQVLSVANTATKERGIDVLARRHGVTTGFEVKGYPSRQYADPNRAHETKKTSPSTQAGHWYAQAVLAAMRLRGREPSWVSAIALPDFPRYRALYAETAAPLTAAQIQVHWVSPAGEVTPANASA